MSQDSTTEIIIEKLNVFLESSDTPSHYEKLLLVDRAAYLDAFIEGKPFPPFEMEIQMSSKCNLQCRWCIGNEIQSEKQSLSLPNNIDERNIDTIVDSIINFRINDLGIDTVKFSGFIGEPLLLKAATLKAMQRLTGAGFRVGLFTNGVLMDSETWDTLVNIDYVHISLDAGPSTYFWLKESPTGQYTENTYNLILDNIRGLNQLRKQKKDRSRLRINIGFILVPGNHEQIYEAAQTVKSAGADSIRFKCDISGKHSLVKAGLLDKVYDEIERVKKDFHNPPHFSVYEIHSKKDIVNNAFSAWQHENGCFYQHFLCTLGSDANLYLCDHNTMPGGVPLGNILNTPLETIWKSKQREYIMEGICCLCKSTVCPPFGNRLNFFLKQIDDLKNEYGTEPLKKAIQILRNKIISQ